PSCARQNVLTAPGRPAGSVRIRRAACCWALDPPGVEVTGAHAAASTRPRTATASDHAPTRRTPTPRFCPQPPPVTGCHPPRCRGWTAGLSWRCRAFVLRRGMSWVNLRDGVARTRGDIRRRRDVVDAEIRRRAGRGGAALLVRPVGAVCGGCAGCA